MSPGEVRNGGEVFGDGIIPEIVGQRISDAEQIAHGILIKAANLEIPIVVDLMLDLDETGIGDEIRARAGLPVAWRGRIDGGRQHNVRLAEINDTAGQARVVGLVVAEVSFDDRTVADMEIKGSARQRTVGIAFRYITLGLAMHDVEPIANGSVRGASARIDILGEH